MRVDLNSEWKTVRFGDLHAGDAYMLAELDEVFIKVSLSGKYFGCSMLGYLYTADDHEQVVPRPDAIVKSEGP